MADTFSYADAVRLLGGGRSRAVSALDNLAGGLLLGGSLLAPGLLSLFDAKAEFARLSRELVSKASEEWHRLGRYDRTERLAAAHSVLVVTAYFEALAEADGPTRAGPAARAPSRRRQGGSGRAHRAVAHRGARADFPPADADYRNHPG